MNLSRLAVSVACLALASGAARASTLVLQDVVPRNTSATYLFHIDAGSVHSSFIESAYVSFFDRPGFDDHSYDTSGYYLNPECFTANCTRTDFSMDDNNSYMSIYSSLYNSVLTIRVESRLKEFNTCDVFTPDPLVCGAKFVGDPTLYVYADYSGEVGDVTITRGAVPEPATWAMMIVGLGLVGATLRRRARWTGPGPIRAGLSV